MLKARGIVYLPTEPCHEYWSILGLEELSYASLDWPTRVEEDCAILGGDHATK